MRSGLLLLAALSFVACVRYPALLPAPNAEPAPEGGALAQQAGVALSVDGAAWEGVPQDLSLVLTPLLVRISNQSGGAIALRYELFTVKGQSGMTYAALPPLHPGAGEAVGQAAARASEKIRPVRRHRNFYVAPYYGPFFDYRPWPYPFLYEPDYYDRYYGYWAPPLPSPDMLTAALPEGVLEQDGEVEGFLYFQRAAEDENTATFEMKLLHAQGERPFGALEIPLIAGKS